jgi:2-keto-4-pentenoate hydratase
MADYNDSFGTGRIRVVSQILVDARRSAIALPDFPGPLFATLEEAYKVQAVSRSVWDDSVVGWKVGGVPAAFIEKAGATHLTGPIFAKSVQRVQDGGHVDVPVFAGGFGAVEPEVIVELGASRDKDRLFIGAEIAGSPMSRINEIGPIAIISDFGNNFGMILGPELSDGPVNAGKELDVECWVNDERIGSRTVPSLADLTGKAVNFLIDHAQRSGIDLPEGTFVSTGAITGIHRVQPGDKARVSFKGMGDFTLSFHAATTS